MIAMSNARLSVEIDGLEQSGIVECVTVRYRPRNRILPDHLLLLLAGYDFAIVTGLAFAAALFYQMIAIDDVRYLGLYAAVSVALALGFAVTAVLDDQYSVARLRLSSAAALRALGSFHIVFGVVVCMLFLTHITDVYSRVSLVLQYLSVSTGLIIARTIMVRVVRRAVESGSLEAKRIALVGPAGAGESFASNLPPSGSGIGIAANFELPPWALHELDGEKSDELQRISVSIVDSLRGSAVDDVILLLPWKAVATADILMHELASIPAGVGLLPEQNLFGLQSPEVSRLGENVILRLQRPPFSAVDQIAKRGFDIFVAASVLVVAAPLLIMIAALVKLDSRGPVLFRQRRHGFNRVPFWITKFRTMNCMEDGDVIPQACAHDPRLTSVGRVLRRSNLDELPQLFDVLRGKMSLVGPRPHALAHDRAYESKILSYTRRHNVKPGMTGWAQVNGFRGETEEDCKMAKRVELDLYYIDNWSLLFDIQIILLTIFSHTAFRNAG